MKSEPELFVKSNLPNLKTSLSSNKPLMALTKVDLDYLINKDPNEVNVKPEKREQASRSYSHKRILSGISKSNIQRQFTKTTRGAVFHEKKFERNKFSNATITHQNSIHGQRNYPPPMLDKAKISTKQAGFVYGYSVNSHPGPMNTSNEDRVCIVTNLNKTTIKNKQICFFGVYDGKNGSNKAEYYRDHFHIILYHDEYFMKDIEKAMKRSIIIIEKNFIEDSRFKDDTSTTSFIIAIILQKMLLLVETGGQKAFISTKLGEKIINPIQKPPQKQRSLSTISRAKNCLMKYQNKNDISIKAIELTNSVDYLVLGSEGLFETLTQKQLGKKIWLELLKSCNENLYLGLGETTNSLMSQVFQGMPSKNVSMILIVFDGIQKCFEPTEKMQLPFVTDEVVPLTKEDNDT